jgi:hypothetical protein
MNALPVTLATAGALGIIYLVLAARVVRGRWTHRVSLGDGGNAAMQRLIRAHGNFGEYVPMLLILMARRARGRRHRARGRASRPRNRHRDAQGTEPLSLRRRAAHVWPAVAGQRLGAVDRAGSQLVVKLGTARMLRIALAVVGLALGSGVEPARADTSAFTGHLAQHRGRVDLESASFSFDPEFYRNRLILLGEVLAPESGPTLPRSTSPRRPTSTATCARATSRNSMRCSRAGHAADCNGPTWSFATSSCCFVR